MGGDQTHPSSTVTRKPDDAVGRSGDAPVEGGHQTSEQAAITRIEAGGRNDAERRDAWSGGKDEAGRNPVPVGGSSQGHSDQKSSGDPDHRKTADGHYKVEKERE